MRILQGHQTRHQRRTPPSPTDNLVKCSIGLENFAGSGPHPHRDMELQDMPAPTFQKQQMINEPSGLDKISPTPRFSTIPQKEESIGTRKLEQDP